MKKKIKGLLYFMMLAFAFIMLSGYVNINAAGNDNSFPSWNADSKSLKELVDFVSSATDKNDPGYIEPKDRIAVFDMDGTILCEKAPVYVDYCLTMYRVLDDPTYKATEEERNAMQQIRDHAYTKGETFKPEGLTKDDMVASAFAGMTPEEFRKYVVKFADNTDVVGFEGMTYSQSFYKPMLEVIEYLRSNGFDIWMVSACEREVVRALVERYDIPYDHVVATDVAYVASGKGDKAADDYNMSKDEEILLGAPLDEVECGKSGKPAAIAREIGRRPVLAFGNSSGDYSMLNYAEGNPYYTGLGFFIVCDDTVREYGSDEKAADFYKKVEEEGWTAISMADDWKTIYGDNVKKTELPGTTQTNEVKVAKPKISVKAVDNSIKVTIKKSLNAEKYSIYIKGSKDKKYRLAASVEANENGKTRYTIEDLEDGNYSVKVRAYNGKTRSRYSKVKKALVGT